MPKLSLVLALLVVSLPLNAEEQPPVADAPVEAVPGLHAGDDYVPVIPAQPTSVSPDEVEVVEFFWYGCPHCYQAEAHVSTWLESKPDGVVFTRVPATLNRGWGLMAQAYYTAEQLGVLDVMHPALFAAFHEQRVPLDDAAALATYFHDKAGVDETTFMEAFDSMAVASRVQRADILARRFRVRGVPMLAVNGKFTTDPKRAGGYQRMVEVADALAKHELQTLSQPE